MILLAADDLVNKGADEFSEWELTVAAWDRDRLRFGLRGFQQMYPDHKRVMMEIMGNKASNPILLKFMEKTRPNQYRLTPLGRVEAGRLRGIESGEPQKGNSMRDLFDNVAPFATHSIYHRWRDEPSEPEKWKDAAAFLGVKSDKPSEPTDRFQAVHTITRAAIDWCLAQSMSALPQGTHRTSPSIHMQELLGLQDFLIALKYRFPDHLDVDAAGKRKMART
jgi:hypothetical protein